MIRPILVTALVLTTAGLAGSTACSKSSCEDTGTCGAYDGPLPYCDGVFRYDDGTECETCPQRDEDGVWRWPDGDEWDPADVEIQCPEGGAAGAGGAAGGGGAAGAGQDGGGAAGAGQGGADSEGGQGGGAGGAPVTCDETALPGDDACVIDEQYAVFVQADAAPDGDGTRTAAFATLAEALPVALEEGKRVYVCADAGSYAESVSLDADHAGLEVFGGFACDDWSYDPTTHRARFESPEPTAWTIDGATDVWLSDLDITAADATQPGTNSVALFLRGGADAVLERVRLQAGNAADGADGTVEEFDYPDVGELVGRDGTAEEGGARCLYTECPPGNGQTTGGPGGEPIGSGTDGFPGSASPAPLDETMGGGGVAGSSCSSGGTGQNGSPGAPGDPGVGATELGSLTSEDWTPASGTDGDPGGPGQGGGGGASMSDAGGGGGGGCGACGGAGATAAQGGGASIALIRFESTVILRDCTLVTGNGGEGGDASPGQAGQENPDLAGSGGIGGVQASSACPGGNGGPGGDGGPSGAGAGGISVGILYHGEMPDLSTVDLELGERGLGGAGVTGFSDTAGTDGVVQNVLEAP